MHLGSIKQNHTLLALLATSGILSCQSCFPNMAIRRDFTRVLALVGWIKAS